MTRRILWPWLSLVCFVLAAGVCSAQTSKDKTVNVRWRTEHYAIGGTVSDDRLREYGKALEFIYKEYDKGFTQLLGASKDKGRSGAGKPRREPGKSEKKGAAESDPKSPRDRKIALRSKGGQRDSKEDDDATEEKEARFPVAIFANTGDYQAQTREGLGHNAEHTIGMFIPSSRMLLIADQGNMRDTQEVLFHEAFHQFLNKHISNPPVWLNEGLAVHYGSAVPTGGGVAFANIPTKRWKLAREAIEGKQAIPIWEVVSASREQFYDKSPIKIDDFEGVTRSSLYYAQAYTLVHMLLNDAEGKKRLQNYIRDLARDDGRNTLEITRKYFAEPTCEKLGPYWVRHVKAGPRSR